MPVNAIRFAPRICASIQQVCDRRHEAGVEFSGVEFLGNPQNELSRRVYPEIFEDDFDNCTLDIEIYGGDRWSCQTNDRGDGDR